MANQYGIGDKISCMTSTGKEFSATILKVGMDGYKVKTNSGRIITVDKSGTETSIYNNSSFSNGRARATQVMNEKMKNVGMLNAYDESKTRNAAYWDEQKGIVTDGQGRVLGKATSMAEAEKVAKDKSYTSCGKVLY